MPFRRALRLAPGAASRRPRWTRPPRASPRRIPEEADELQAAGSLRGVGGHERPRGSAPRPLGGGALGGTGPPANARRRQRPARPSSAGRQPTPSLLPEPKSSPAPGLSSAPPRGRAANPRSSGTRLKSLSAAFKEASPPSSFSSSLASPSPPLEESSSVVEESRPRWACLCSPASCCAAERNGATTPRGAFTSRC
ncbi:unnamed protein product [Prorocentrum cordatum]|uniref:Uncharacterized protein n=1 Tax=Prorocentrum cordatum TaxID=2364126 RepID=A0ABN9R494_9DINO|nr:unnamed protein product [Polarella glacialis]